MSKVEVGQYYRYKSNNSTIVTIIKVTTTEIQIRYDTGSTGYWSEKNIYLYWDYMPERSTPLWRAINE